MNLITLSRLILQVFVHMLLDRVEQRVEQFILLELEPLHAFVACTDSGQGYRNQFAYRTSW